MYDQQRRSQEQWYSALAQAKDDGIEQGIEQGIYQVALTMLKQGFEIQTIVSATGLSETDLERIVKENLV